MTGSRLARASFWAVAGSAGQYVIVFLLLVYLARILQPRDFGLMATVSVGLDLGMLIARWGQVELLQQSRYKTDAARNQAIRVSLLLGILFATGFAFAAQPLAAYFAAPELELMLYLCAPVFIFSGLSATAEGILRSEYRFRLLAFRGTITALIGAAPAIALAAGGFGGLALAAQRLVQSVVALVWVWSAVNWRPSFSVKSPFSGVLMHDGASLMTGTLLPMIVPRSIDLFVSVTLGPAPLGLMRVAFRIFEFVGQLVIMPLVGVATTQLSQFGDDLAGLRRSYLQFTQISATLLCPLMIGFAVVAPEAVPLLFGPKWVACVPLVQMVSILALTAPPNYYFPAAMVAIGQSRLVLRQGLFQVVVGLALAAVAVQYSLTAVLIAQIVRGLIVALYNVVDMKRWAGLTWRALGRAMAPPYVGTAVMALAMFAMRDLLAGRFSPMMTLLILGAGGATIYLVVILLGARRGWWPELAVLFERFLPLRLRRVLLSR